MPNSNEIQRIAAAMAAIRPDWRQSSLVTFLTKNHAQRAYADLAIAAIVVALDPVTKTPELLNQHGPWWSAAYVASGQGTEPVGAGREPSCDQPGHEHELARACRACRSEAIAALPPPADAPRCPVDGHEHELAGNCRICAADALESSPDVLRDQEVTS